MYGIQAINAQNGWAMALAGAIIVMCGLSVLSFIISQLHKIVALMENRKAVGDAAGGSDPQPERGPEEEFDHDLSNLSRNFSKYRTVTAKLGDAFAFQDLFALFRDYDFPHPHLTIRSLKEEGFLVPAGQGLYSWKNGS